MVAATLIRFRGVITVPHVGNYMYCVGVNLFAFSTRRRRRYIPIPSINNRNQSLSNIIILQTSPTALPAPLWRLSYVRVAVGAVPSICILKYSRLGVLNIQIQFILE